MIRTKNWEAEHSALVLEIFGVEPYDDIEETNLNIRELSKPVVFLVKGVGENIHHLTYHGFSSIEEAVSTLVNDMIDAAYRGSSIDQRYSIVSKDTEIVGTLFQGKVVRFHPVTSHVAVLIKDPNVLSEEETARFKEFDTLAGSIPHINLEVLQDERKESESPTQDNQSDDGELIGQGELFDSESSHDSYGSQEDL